VAWWLKKPAEDPRWRELIRWSAESATERPVPQPGAPFSEAEEAYGRLLDAKVSGAVLAEWLTAQSHEALARLRELLARRKWRSGELSDLHESLLSADPSGLDAAPGSWPDPPAGAEVPAHGPRLTLKKSHALAFSPDGARVVASKGGVITELASGKVLAKCEFLAHTSHVAWSPDGKWIAGQSTSGDIAVCAAETGKRAHELAQKCEGVAPQFTSARELIGATWGGDIFRWDVEQGRLLGGVRLSVSMLLALELAEDGELVALVRLESDALACVRVDPELKKSPRARPVPSWTSHLSLDGARGRALLTGQDYAAWLDLKTGKVSEPIDGFGPIVESSVSPDGKWFALANLRAFRIGLAEDLATGRTYEIQFANTATFSADSRQIALATWQGGELWDVEALYRAAS
jgi:WD40 repeat protein